MVVVFVVKCLENVLKSATAGSWPAFKVHVPSCSKICLPCAGVDTFEQACRNQISKLLTHWRFVGSLQKCCGRNEENGWKFQSMSKTEGKSREMGEASHKACFNITNGKSLNIKVDGGLSETVDGYYLQKQFQSLVAESGYPIDESYESSVKWSRNCTVDPYINLDWRIRAALQSFREKYLGSMDNVVVVFVDKSLESVLRRIGIQSQVLFKLHAPTDCNPLLWFIMIKNLPSYFPSQCKAVNKGDIFDSPAISLAERRILFMGSSSRDAGINITDVLKIKIDGGFSESIQHYHVHEQLKASIMDSGYPIDRTYETSYNCAENCNYETSIKMEERLAETVKSIRAKHSDSTNRTVIVFVDKNVEQSLQFLIKQPLITLELYIVKKWAVEYERKKIKKSS
ncbi:hypothetical protein T4E_6490 [Trichinella pseudospiralis]|uniref:Uncharacterized protein n=1 Tax=Trichinella pseudospiralis TaxID=6337 RepID=A0A0V0Y029_TRIPS|nr:hypothetical protein T4E_10630 [Trichinella pseudospiralis]KRX93372.1 hypothetical protein T4E_6490 [Trichinella pseudospiralis]